jgi:hypothetical protein
MSEPNVADLEIKPTYDKKDISSILVKVQSTNTGHKSVITEGIDKKTGENCQYIASAASKAVRTTGQVVAGTVALGLAYETAVAPRTHVHVGYGGRRLSKKQKGGRDNTQTYCCKSKKSSGSLAGGDNVGTDCTSSSSMFCGPLSYKFRCFNTKQVTTAKTNVREPFIIKARTSVTDANNNKWYATKIKGKWYHFKIIFNEKYKTFTSTSVGKNLKYMTITFENDEAYDKMGKHFFDNLFTTEVDKKKKYTYVFIYHPDQVSSMGNEKTAAHQFWKNLIEIEDKDAIN